MKEIPFSIPVSGVVRIDEDQATIIVNRAETIISLLPETMPGKRTLLEQGKTMYNVILEIAQERVLNKGFNRFSAPELYYKALEKYPGLKRGSFMSRVVACTPDHSSYKHYTSKRDYFSHIGPGLFKLNDEYVVESSSDDEVILRNK
ncbi:MAG: hypothetical protein WBB97_11045 [Dehalococcoidales bacterium]